MSVVYCLVHTSQASMHGAIVVYVQVRCVQCRYLLASELLGLVEGLVEVIFTAAVGHFYCRWVGGWLVGTWYAWVVGGQKWLRDQRSNVVIDLVVVREQRDSKG